MKSFILTCLVVFFGALSACHAEWSHYTERKGMTIFISKESSPNRKCKGQKEASEQKFSLGEWHYVRELCYSINAKGDPVFSDPGSINPLSSFTISSDGFIYIPTAAEKKAAAEKERVHRFIESMRSENADRQRRIEKLQQQDGPTHMIINGNPALCIRIGAMLDCN